MDRRLIVVVLTALCALIPCHRTRADTRVTVHDFYGPGAQRMRADVLGLLERQSGVTIVTQGQIDSTARRLRVDPFSPEGRRTLSRELQLSAWLTGMVKRRSGRLTLTLLVFDGAEHARIGRTQLSGSSVRQLSAKIRGQLWGKAERAILGAAAPALAAKSPLDEPLPASGQVDMVVTAEQAESHRLASERGASREALRVFVGVGSPYRSLAYRDAVTSTLGDYQLSGAPMADVALSFFPARLVSDGWASWLGLDARALLALSTPTRDQAGGQLKSRYDAFHVGLRARVPVGRHTVSVFSGYAVSHFTVTPLTASFTSPTPSVDYRSIRSGLGGELALGESTRLGLDAAYLSYLDVGEIGRWFPRATAGGIELGLFGTYAITPAIHARVSAAYQRTFFDFHARPGDKNIAGGALDQYLSLSLGAGVAL
jgi:hypothetical protein